MFADRKEAGRKLAEQLAKLNLARPVVLALPRGGVPVAVEIAEALSAPVDLVIVRKVGAPGNAELAVAALVDGNPPDVILNREIIEAYGLGDEDLAILIAQERPELERRRALFRLSPEQPIKGRNAILVDDGAATGTTMKVALKALNRRSPREIIVALPVASARALDDISSLANRVVCLDKPADFRALSYHYRNFEQVSDEEVRRLLEKQTERLRKAKFKVVRV